MTTTVVLSDLFNKYQDEIDGSIKNRVLDFIMKLQQDPASPGLKLKTPQGVADKRIKVGRVNDDLRAVVMELPDALGYSLVAVRRHDAAYKLAGELQLGVNAATGALEVVNQAETMRAIERSKSTPADPAARPMLDGVRSKTLVQVGVAPDVAERLVEITDEGAFYDVLEALPRTQSDAVLDLASGKSAEEVWADYVDRAPDAEIDTEDYEAALKRPISRLSNVSIENAEEFQAALAGGLEAWRVWLHPAQRKLAEHEGWNGPYRVTGGAGTGKTVTLVHRAHYLAKRLDEHAAPPTERVLVTTFTRNLAQAIQHMLFKVGGKALLDRVSVVNVDAIAMRMLRAAGWLDGVQVVSDTSGEVAECWELACTAEVAEVCNADFLQAEWRDVVLAQGLTTREDYLRAPRPGRGRRLSRPQRDVVWRGIERFGQLMDADGKLTFTQAVDRAAAVAKPAYAHVLVDEAQDLHQAHWRLLRRLVAPRPDDLFIAGDAHQRIYGRPIVLSHCGIQTRGRSRRLTVNYRTSRQILQWCLAVASGQPVDDLEGESESLANARSVFDGPVPEQVGFSSAGEEADGVAARIAGWLAEGSAPDGTVEAFRPREIAVIARDHWSLDRVGQALRAAGIPTARVDAEHDDEELGDGVRLVTMHRAKGLEYRVVAIVAAGDGHLPPKYVRELPDEAREYALAQERNLLYVAGSRARERLLVTWSGQPSALLPGQEA